ncbi:DUF1289 domain-containing protein [Litorilituus lipolyticus]|uniref:DUF1289 domain-containing protein n=1 Tax=Litorilituus lipolyticus TaxID=2491017 RepID=UPI001FEA3D05|nr:DUF1289 domain-containing protein [Litorilituus lipolyticus]
MNNVQSPCVRNCCLNEQDICLGCFRSLEEIKQWGLATNQEKQTIVSQANSRKMEHEMKSKPY